MGLPKMTHCRNTKHHRTFIIVWNQDNVNINQYFYLKKSSLFFRVSSLAYPNLLGKKGYVVVVVVVKKSSLQMVICLLLIYSVTLNSWEIVKLIPFVLYVVLLTAIMPYYIIFSHELFFYSNCKTITVHLANMTARWIC